MTVHASLQPVTLYMSSRTDSGVHALATAGHVNVIRRVRHSQTPHPEPFDPTDLLVYLNHWLRRNDHATRIVKVRPSVRWTPLQCVRAHHMHRTCDAHCTMNDHAT